MQPLKRYSGLAVAAAGLIACFLMIPSALAQTATPSVSVSLKSLVSQQRAGRTLFVYSYEVEAANDGASPPYGNVSVSASGSGGTEVLSSAQSCGDLWGNQTGQSTNTCSGTFSIRQNRRQPVTFEWVVNATPLADADSDGVPNDGSDNCPAAPNPLQEDADQDGQGDACDTCPNDPDNDADDDGICGDVDACPDDPANLCAIDVTVSGTVTGSGAGLNGAAVQLGTNTVTTTTDGSGFFSASAGPDEVGYDGLNYFINVEASAAGYGTGYAKVNLETGVNSYNVELDLLPVSDEILPEDDVAAGVQLTDEGEVVGEITIPSSSFPAGATQITGSVTYLDPTSDDLTSFAGGDFFALPVGANPNEEEIVTLESLGVMEFDLVDQDGNPITELDGPATVCMTIPDDLLPTVSDGDQIPLWYYDPEQGLWIEEGFGVVDLTGANAPRMCGEVTHFTWWNYDRPINTHACFKFHFVDETTGDYVDDLTWSLEGVNWTGGAWERKCDCDANDPGPGDDPTNPPYFGSCPVSRIDSFTVIVSPAAGPAYTSRVYTNLDGTRYYLKDDGDGTYSLSTNVDDALIVENPSAQGSCFAQTDVDACVFLDYQDGQAPNGILPLATPNRAPVISNFTLSPTNLAVLESAAASAGIVDPEGDDFTVDWTTQCFDGVGAPGDALMTPATDGAPASASPFLSTFTAPSALIGSIVQCEITVTATDTSGNASSATRYLVVTAPGEGCVIEGYLYGPDGNPLANAEVRLDETAFCGDYNASVDTDGTGFYRFDDVPCCDACGGGQQLAFEGSLSFEIDQDGQPWNVVQDLYQGCPLGDFDSASSGGVLDALDGSLRAVGPAPIAETQAGIGISPRGGVCRNDIYTPTVWGTLEGTRYPSPAETGGSSQFLSSYNVNLGSGELGGSLYLGTSLSGQPGTVIPFSLPHPVAEGVVFDAITTGRLGYSIPAQGQTVTQDINGVGTVTGTAYDDNGPVGSGVAISLSGAQGDFQASTTTDGSGSYSFSDVPTGQVFVTGDAGSGPSGLGAYASGYLATNGSTVQVDLYSPERCDLIGTLFNFDGVPLAGGDVSFNTYFGGGPDQPSDADGGFIFQDIQPDLGFLGSFLCVQDPVTEDFLYCLDTFRNFGVGSCPSGGAALQYDLPSFRIDSECSGFGQGVLPSQLGGSAG
jgi:hypothetical protein